MIYTAHGTRRMARAESAYEFSAKLIVLPFLICLIIISLIITHQVPLKGTNSYPMSFYIANWLLSMSHSINY